MDKKNILSQEQDKIEPTKNLLDLNQLSQLASHSQKFQKQEYISNIQKDQEDLNIPIKSEYSDQKELKTKIARGNLSQNKIFQNAMSQIITQKKDQGAISPCQKQGYECCIQNISSKNQNDFQQNKNSSSNELTEKKGQIKQKQKIVERDPRNQISFRQFQIFEEKTEINLQKDEYQHNKEQTLKQQLTYHQENNNNQESSEISFQHNNSYLKNELTERKETDIDLKNDQLQHGKNQNLKNEQTIDKKQDNQQEKLDREAFKQENNLSQNDTRKKQDQIKKNQTIKESIFNNEVNLFQIQKIQEKTDMNLKNGNQQSNNEKNLNDYHISNYENVDTDKKSQQQGQQIEGEQTNIIQSEHKLQQVILNQEQISEQDSQSTKDRRSIPILQNDLTVQQEDHNITNQQSLQDNNTNFEKQDNYLQIKKKKRQHLKQQIKMEKQNILSQGQDYIEPTIIQLDVNQLSQQVPHTQQFQNQKDSFDIQNELEATNITTISEQTLSKKVRSQIRRFLCQSRIIQNATCQVINQKENQHAILSYQNQDNTSSILQLSSKKLIDQSFQSQHEQIFQQDKDSQHNNFSQKGDQIKLTQTTKEQIINKNTNYQKLKYIEEKIDKQLNNDQKEHKKEQNLLNEQTSDLRNANQQSYANKESFQLEINCPQNDLTQKKGQKKDVQIDKDPISNNKNDCKEIIPIQEKTEKNKQNSDQQHNHTQDLKQKEIHNEGKVNLKESTEEQKNQPQQQSQQIDDNQRAILQLDQIQQKDNLSQKNTTNHDSQSPKGTTSNQPNTPITQQEIQQDINMKYSQLKELFHEIQDYKFDEYKIHIMYDQGLYQVKKLWEQEIFDEVNCSQTQNEKFKSQKLKIFERLKQEQFYLCKIIYSNQIEDLILGFYLDDYDDFEESENLDEYIFKIIYTTIESDIDLQNQIIQTLGLQFEIIKLEQENISILGFRKKDYLSFSEKIELLVECQSKLKQIEENYYEINSQNCQECQECNDQITCENKNCFKNIKSVIKDFFKYKKYWYCEPYLRAFKFSPQNQFQLFGKQSN
ncbi:hypothetical protein ABPG73_006435 [Tetrahymena malaccensis]